MASGRNLWAWLQCIGVASRCCCKEVYRYPHNCERSEPPSLSNCPRCLYIYRIARNFRGLKFSRIGLPENFRNFIFADGRFDLMTYDDMTQLTKISRVKFSRFEADPRKPRKF